MSLKIKYPDTGDWRHHDPEKLDVEKIQHGRARRVDDDDDMPLVAALAKQKWLMNVNIFPNAQQLSIRIVTY